jgi:hypothetical protein
MLSNKTLAALTAAAALALPSLAQAAQGNTFSLNCSVAIDYVNGTVSEPYRKDFVVGSGVAFADDFSTPIRQKRFVASAARQAGNLVVAIDYFNDVGVFHSVAFSTQLALREGRNIDSTSGSHVFSTSIGVPGNHTTNYTLSCKRA